MNKEKIKIKDLLVVPVLLLWILIGVIAIKSATSGAYGGTVRKNTAKVLVGNLTTTSAFDSSTATSANVTTMIEKAVTEPQTEPATPDKEGQVSTVKISTSNTTMATIEEPKRSEVNVSTRSRPLQAKNTSRRCLISSKGKDGVGHQLTAKLSCIATAAALERDLEYVHIPMTSAEHGTNPTSFETFVGIHQSLSNVKVLLNDQQQYQIKKREPLPWVGKCQQPSWFQPEIRQLQCQNAIVTTVFVADNCWDYFYCTLKRDDNFTVLVEQTFAKLRAGYMELRRQRNSAKTSNTSSRGEEAARALTVVVHIRGIDSGKGREANAYYSHLIRHLVDASSNGGAQQSSFIVHTNQVRFSQCELLPELGDSYNVTIRDKTLVSMETVFDDMVQADILVASISSLSVAAALLGRAGRPVLYPFEEARVGLCSLQGWTMLRQSGNNGMECFQRLESAWQAIDGDFYRKIILDAQKSKAQDLL